VRAKYSIEIPKDVIWVTNWDQLHEIGANYPDTALVEKYGGNIIEVNGKIVVATDEEMTKQIDDLIKELEKNDIEVEAETDTSKRRAVEIGPYHQCSHPRCFYAVTCHSYTDCHVCRRPTAGRGICI
jgi:L-2-hydroxyglutarate oxidase LhgO